MTPYTAETWMRQRGTFPTTAKTLVRDLGLSAHGAGTQLGRLAKQGIAVRLCRGRYLHRDTFPEHHMSTIVLTDEHGAERHRVDFPTRTRAEIALRIIEGDLRAKRQTVRVVGADIHDPLYTVAGVKRAMIQPAALPASSESEATAFDARYRAAGDDR